MPGWSLINLVGRGQRIARFMALWVGAILLSVLVLGIYLLVATGKLERMSQRILQDTAIIDATHVLEKKVIAQRREDLLFRVTGLSQHRSNRDERLKEADLQHAGLRMLGTFPEEPEMVREIHRHYSRYHDMAVAVPATDAEQLAQQTDRLLRSLTDYRERNQEMMRDTIGRSRRLDWTINLMAWIALVLILGVGIAGMASLWVRIFRPVLHLTRAAAAVGRGNLAERVPVLKDDEMGELCSTFNAMAEEIAARENERLMFVAALVHDLKNPLTVASAGLQMLQRGLLTDQGEADQWLGKIRRQVDRLEGMTHDLMDTVQAHTGQLEVHLDTVDVPTLVRGAVLDHEKLAQGRKIHLDALSACQVRADRRLLERVVWNLLSNAIKYSPDDTEIFVQVRQAGDRVLVSIRDQGEGISKEELKQLFRPFGRLSRTSEMARGTGLGLYSVKKIVEAHGGSIEVRSERGGGATMEVSLPCLPGAS